MAWDQNNPLVYIPDEGLDPDAIVPVYSDDGVDLSLIRFMLSLSPAQRLDVLRDTARFAAWGEDVARRNRP